jgi:hypothetical protein
MARKINSEKKTLGGVFIKFLNANSVISGDDGKLQLASKKQKKRHSKQNTKLHNLLRRTENPTPNPQKTIRRTKRKPQHPLAERFARINFDDVRPTYKEAVGICRFPNHLIICSTNHLSMHRNIPHFHNRTSV